MSVPSHDIIARARLFFRVCALFILATLSGCKGATLALDFYTSNDGRKATLSAMCIEPVPAWITCIDQDGKFHLSFNLPPSRPFSDSKGDIQLPCGKCLGCRQDSANRWSVRLSCELLHKPRSSFITLTYNPENLPSDNQPVKAHLQKFLKRLRQSSRDYGASFSDLKYFIVSEHGKQGTFRLHYHALIFGIDFFDSPWNAYLHHIQPDGNPLYTSDLLAKVWSHGFVSTDVATPSNISYIGKYLTKMFDNSEIRIFSQRLGVGLFCSFDERHCPNGLLPSGCQAYVNGFIVLPSRYNCFKVATPKFLDRYAACFRSDLYDSLKQSRRAYALQNLPCDSVLADYKDYLIHQASKLKERKLHYDQKPVCYS